MPTKELPTYTEPSKGAAVRSNSHDRAHELVDKGDPKVNGPYLDDVREKQEETYRKNRKTNLRAHDKKAKRSSTAKKKTASQQKKAKDALNAAREKVLAEQNREVPNTLKPLEPADSLERPNHEAPYETKTHPEQRPLSNPSNPGVKEDNLPVPKLEDVKVPEKAVAKTKRPRHTEPPKKRKSTAKKSPAPAKKTTAKKSTPVAKKAPAKKATSSKTAVKKTAAAKTTSRKK